MEVGCDEWQLRLLSRVQVTKPKLLSVSAQHVLSSTSHWSPERRVQARFDQTRTYIKHLNCHLMYYSIFFLFIR